MSLLTRVSFSGSLYETQGCNELIFAKVAK